MNDISYHYKYQLQRYHDFDKLSDAIGHASKDNDSVFSFEVNKWKRRFLVANPRDFWSLYKTLPLKNYYEVILCNQKSKA